MSRFPRNGAVMRGRSPATGNSSNSSNSRGAILLGVLIAVFTVSLIGAGLAALLFSVSAGSDYEVSQAKALYLAEAGISQAVYLLQSQGGAISPAGEHFIAPAPLGDGAYEVRLDFSEALITSIGYVGAVKRKIQLKYNPF